VPEHTVAIAKGLIRMRVKHFPAIFLAANTISGIVLGTETAMFLAYFGFMTAWIYLRFFRVSPSLVSSTTGDGSVTKGDASDTFAFAHFFPEPIYTPLAAITDGIYNTCVTLGVCTPFSEQDIDAGNEQASARAEGGLPSIMNPNGRGGRGGATRAEAERRRALALKALDCCSPRTNERYTSCSLTIGPFDAWRDYLRAGWGTRTREALVLDI
jgi:hypothetical protein